MKGNWKKFVLFGLIGVALGGGAIVVYSLLRGDAVDAVEAMRGAYKNAMTSYEAKDYERAARQFDEARILADQALQRINDERKRLEENGELTTDKIKAYKLQIAEVMHTYYQASVLMGYAKQSAKGKPTEKVRDAWLATDYFSLTNVADKELRQDGFNSLQNAANEAPESLEIQRDMLRAMAWLETIPWAVAEQCASNVLAIDKATPLDDRREAARANFFLAWFDVEQPNPTNNTPALWTDRNRRRILDARDRLRTVLSAKNVPYWRTKALEVEIAAWLAEHYERENDTASRGKEMDTARKLLFDKESGALTRAGQLRDCAELELFEARAFLKLHRLALALLGRSAAGNESDRQALWNLAVQSLERSKQISEGHAEDRFFLSATSETALTALQSALPVVDSMPDAAADWTKAIATCESVLETALAQKVLPLSRYGSFAQFLAFEALRQKDKDKRKALRARSLQWIDKGLKLGKTLKLPKKQLAQLHAISAEQKALQDADLEDVKKQVRELDALGDASITGMTEFIKAFVATREGRLGRAIEHLRLSRMDRGNPRTTPVRALLGVLYVAVKKPALALEHLDAVYNVLADPAKLINVDRAWLQRFGLNQISLTLSLIRTNLDVAVERRRVRGASAPGGDDAVRFLEERARALVESLPKQAVDARFRASRLLGSYYVQTGQVRRAKEVLEELQATGIERIETLEIELGLLIAEAIADARAKGETLTEQQRDAVNLQVDRRLESFLEASPTNVSAKLLKARWLLQTNRPDKAAELLRKLSDLADEHAAQAQFLLARALLQQGEDEAAGSLLQGLPPSRLVVASLLQTVPTSEERAKQVQAALDKVEEGGLSRFYTAVLDAANQQHKKAALGFLSTLEHTNLETISRVNLTRMLFLMAGQDPIAALAFLTEQMKQHPKEPALYLAYARCRLLLDELGAPGDSWDRLSRTMAAALDQWEQSLDRDDEQSRITAPLTKVAYWQLANDVDRAWLEAQRALGTAPDDPRVLHVVASLALNDHARMDDAEKALARLVKVAPKAAETQYLRALVLEKQEKTDEAVQQLQALIAAHENHARGRSRLYQLLIESNRTAEAEKVVRDWRKSMPDSMEAASAEVRHLAATNRLDQALKAGQEYLDAQLQKRKAKLQRDKPKDADQAKKWQEWADQQVERLKRVIETEWVKALYRAEQWDAAKTALKPYVEDEATEAAARVHLAEILMRQEKWSECVAQYRKVLALQENNDIARNNLAWVLAVKLDKAGEAYPLAKAARANSFTNKPMAIARFPAAFLDTLGEIYSKKKDAALHSEMRAVFEAASQRYANDPRMALYRARALEWTGSKREALSAYKDAIDLASSSIAKQRFKPDVLARVVREAEAGKNAVAEEKQ